MMIGFAGFAGPYDAGTSFFVLAKQTIPEKEEI